jgi:epoxide hydrolase-like predicted phosphatase
MSIRAVIFDFGGVLYFTPDLSWVKRWQTILGLKDDPFISTILSSPDSSEFVNDVMVGKIPESQVWETLAKRWGISQTLVNRMRRGTFSSKRWNKDLARFIESVRPNYKTAILSNAGSDARQTFTRAYKIDQLVDEIIISAEEKIAKPNERIYQIATERLGINPDEAIFVDDLLPNIEAARKYGMHGIQFLETNQVIADVQKILG